MVATENIRFGMNLGQPTYVELIVAERLIQTAIKTICYDDCGEVKCDQGQPPIVRLRQLAFGKPKSATVKPPCKYILTQGLPSQPVTRNKSRYSLGVSSKQSTNLSPQIVSDCDHRVSDFLYLRPNTRKARLYRPDGYSLYYRPSSVFMANGDGTLFFSGLTIDSRDNFVLDPCTPAATVETSRPGLAISEIQRITLPTPSGGTYDVTVTIKGDSQTATNIPYDASAAQLRVRLGQLSNIGGTRNILVSGDGSQLFPFELEFVGDLGITNVDPVTVNAENLIGTGTAVFRTLVDGTVNSKQRMTIDDSLQPYSFRFNGFTTIRLPYDATLSQVQSALSALPSIRLNNIIVTGLTTDRDARYVGPLFFEFTGALAGQPMPQMSVITTGNYIITTDSVGGVGLNEIQELSIVAKSGFFKITMTNPSDDATATTGPIPYDADATVVRNALITAIPWINSSNIVVSQVSDGVWRFRFTGSLGKIDIAPSTVNGDNLSGAEAIVRPVRNGRGTSEEQIISLLNTTGGTFRLEIKIPQTGAINKTSPIPYNASAADVQNALENLSGISPGDVFVSGQRALWIITFNALFGNVDDIVVDVSDLVCDPAFLKPVPKPPYLYSLPKPVIEQALPEDTSVKPISSEANVSTQVIYQKHLFDPDLKINGKKRTLRQIALISGYDPDKYNPYIRSCDNKVLSEAVYDAIIESQTNFVLIPINLDSESERDRTLRNIGSSRQILPTRFAWDCYTA